MKRDSRGKTKHNQPRVPESLEPRWIALYGTLMRGLGATEALGISDRLRFVGPCVCRGELFDLGDYPGLRPGAGRVAGEIHELRDPDVLSLLDEFEGFDPEGPQESLYLRECVRLLEPADQRAWIYVINQAPDPASKIDSGDWRAHIANRSQ